MYWIPNLFIISEMWLVILGQTCKMSDGTPGFCREIADCYGVFEHKTCPTGFACCFGTGQAKKKCTEYSKYVPREVYSIVLTPKVNLLNSSDCAVDAVSLIVGGKKASPKEFPHMVAIGYGKDLKSVVWLCGGTLISEIFVLSAAHCSNSSEGGPANFARLGAVDLKNPQEKNLQDKNIIRRINHPQYKYPSNYDDIALFELDSPATMNAFVRPACLHLTPTDEIIKEATATGWGKMKFNDDMGSPELMKVPLSFVDNQKCNKTYAADVGGKILRKGIIHKQICAGDEQGEKDTCQGDSGGPLQVVLEDPYCMFSIVGVTSFGKFCGFKNTPAVYSRVFYYVPWIESVVWPKSS